MTFKLRPFSVISSTILLTSFLQAEALNLDPIIMSADFQHKKLSKTSNSSSSLKEDKLSKNVFVPIESTLSLSPNLNFSTGSSRAHYLQIRGIGEYSQFTSMVNPSIALRVDGIDVSENALALTGFDLSRIEIHRGPQMTLYGSNAMGGVISLESKAPSKEREIHLESSMGNYNTYAYGAAIGGTIIKDTLLGRLSVFKNTSDGYMTNSTLNRTDTQNIDEMSLKGQIRWLASENHTIDMNYLHVNVDNGYDAFTLDNSRRSHADQIGSDKLTLNGFALKSLYQVDDIMHLRTTTSTSSTKTHFDHDVDWTTTNEHPSGYSAFDTYQRNRDKTDFDIRLVSDTEGRLFYGTLDWAFGAYYKEKHEELTHQNTSFSEAYKSKMDTSSLAFYAQMDMAVTPVLTLTAGARMENHKVDFSDNDLAKLSIDEALVGGKVGFTLEANRHKRYYVMLSQGYNPGGMNSDKDIALASKAYDAETLWNLDYGVNSYYYKGALTTRFNLFYGVRKEQQIKNAYALAGVDGNINFREYVDNRARTHYYGIEYEANYSPVENVHLFANIGALRSKFDSYDNTKAATYDVSGRSTAYAPRYQYSFGMNTMVSENWNIDVDVEGKSAYYFSNRDAQKARAYSLINASVTYLKNNLSVQLWAKNITNVEYETRGVGSIGKNPSKAYDVEYYTQKGNPRTYGLTVGYDF